MNHKERRLKLDAVGIAGVKKTARHAQQVNGVEHRRLARTVGPYKRIEFGRKGEFALGMVLKVD